MITREIKREFLNFDLVVDCILKYKTFIQRSTENDFTIDIIILSDKDFRLEIFNYRRFLKNLSDPKERVAYFETVNEHGVFCLKKHDKVLKARIKSGEDFDSI